MRKTVFVFVTTLVCLSITAASYGQGKGGGKGGGGGGDKKSGKAAEIPVTVTFLNQADDRIQGDNAGIGLPVCELRLDLNPFDPANSYVDGCQQVDARLQFGNDPFPGSLDLFTNESPKDAAIRMLELIFVEADCQLDRFPDPKPSECGKPFLQDKAEAEFQVLVLDENRNRFEGHLLAMPVGVPMKAAVEVNLFLEELWSVWFDVFSQRERCGDGKSDSATIVRTQADRWEIQATSAEIACLTHNTHVKGSKPAIVVEGYYPLPFHVVVTCNNPEQCLVP